jgi:hypothetical protein
MATTAAAAAASPAVDATATAQPISNAATATEQVATSTNWFRVRFLGMYYPHWFKYMNSSNNPFAPSVPTSPSQPTFPSQPPSNRHEPVQFNLQGSFANNESKPSTSDHSVSPTPSSDTNSPAPAPPPQFRPPKIADNEHAKLASLFANRDDGQDTFGNVGALRCVHVQISWKNSVMIIPTGTDIRMLDA